LSLPFVFANVSTLVTSQLDANYNALGALTPISCVVAGTNALALTPEANTPTVSAYANYMIFTGIAVATNTSTPVTAAVGSNSALNIYKDSQSGPVALAIGDIVINTAIVLIYDSALNGGAGGFHLHSGSAYLPANGGLAGSLQIGNTATTITNFVSAAQSIAWPNVAANSGTISTIPVTGASVGDCVIVGATASVPTGISFFGWVSTVGTVTLQALNNTGAPITPIAGTYRVTASRYTP